MRRLFVSLLASFLVVGLATVALADHDWASGCNDGNTCFWDGSVGSSQAEQTDHEDLNINSSDQYDNGNRVDHSTDHITNNMNTLHAHYWDQTNRNGNELGCLEINDPGTIHVHLTSGDHVHSWDGHTGSCP